MQVTIITNTFFSISKKRLLSPVVSVIGLVMYPQETKRQRIVDLLIAGVAPRSIGTTVGVVLIEPRHCGTNNMALAAL